MSPEPSESSFLVRYRTPLLAALGLMIYVPFLGLRDMWYPDEPDIAEVCLAMFRSGDWIAPRRLGVVWVDYPPMIYWAGTLFSHLLRGISDFALRLPNALSAVALALVTCFAGSRWFSPRAGLAAGFMLLSFVQFAHQAVSYRPDVILSLTIGAGLVVYATGSGERARWLPRMAGFALFGLAMLSKGPMGLLLPGLVLTLWHGSRREWRRLLELAPLTLLALAVYLPWFVACSRAMGSENMFGEFYAQNIERFYSAERGHARPFHFYATRIVLDLWPWAPLLPAALLWIHRRRLWSDRHVQLAAWWLAAFFVVLSVATTKRQLYMLPAYPAFALLLAPWVAAFFGERAAGSAFPALRPARICTGIVLVAFAVVTGALFTAVVAFEPIRNNAELNPLQSDVAGALRLPLLFAALLFAVGTLWAGRAWFRGDIRGVLVRVGLIQIPLYLLLLAWLVPVMNPLKTYRPAGEWIKQRIGSETTFGIVAPHSSSYYGKAGAFGYYSEALVQVLGNADDVQSFLREHPDSVVLVSEWRTEEIFGEDEARWRRHVVRELVARYDRFLVVQADPRPPG